LVSCTTNSLEYQYITEAQKVSDSHGVLKPIITLKSQTVQDSKVIYHLEISSDYFANQVYIDTYSYLNDLYQIIDSTDPRTAPIVYSGDRVYKLDLSYDRTYTVNDTDVFPDEWTGESTSSSSYSGSSSNSDTSWFSGGTLHKSTISEWRNATYANRLATSADFIAATQNVDYGDMVAFKKMATDLETCISTAASGGDMDNDKTSFIAAMCTVQLFPK
jgi:hypothetical protein